MTDHDHKRVPEDYPGLADGGPGEPVTNWYLRSDDDHEHRFWLWTDERDEPIRLRLTPTQVRQLSKEFDIREHVLSLLFEGKPDPDDTVLKSTLGDAYHHPEAEGCAAVNAYDTAIDQELTVREAIEDGMQPCRHCFDVPDGWSQDALREEVLYGGE